MDFEREWEATHPENLRTEWPPVIDRHAFIAVLLLGIAGCACALDGWHSDWNTALDAAKSSGKPLLAVFAQDSCPECTRFENQVSGSSARTALRNAIKVRVEYNDNPRLAGQMGVKVTPTTVLLTAAGNYETVAFRQQGALGSRTIASLGRTIDRHCNTPRQNTPQGVATEAQQPANSYERPTQGYYYYQPSRYTPARRPYFSR